MTRDDWKRFETLKNGNEDVQFSMRARCEEQGHEFENCCSIVFQVYQQCKWCGDRR